MSTQANKILDASFKIGVAILVAASIAAFRQWEDVGVYMATNDVQMDVMRRDVAKIDTKVEKLGCKVDALGVQNNEILVQLARFRATEDRNEE